MARIGTCPGCGAVYSELWGRREECPRCQTATEHRRIPLGVRDLLPKVLNVVGALVLGAAMVTILLADLDFDPPVIAWIAVGPLLILGSLALQIFFNNELVRRMEGGNDDGGRGDRGDIDVGMGTKRAVRTLPHRHDRDKVRRPRRSRGRRSEGAEDEVVRGMEVPVKYPAGHGVDTRMEGGRKIIVRR